MGHLDHDGVDPSLKGDKIYNGAMDNAAGIATLLALTDQAGELLDRGLVTFFPSPNSYTGEDMAELGASIGKNVTKKTTLLVAGTWATKTSKQKRAEELIAKGQEIDIWSAEQLYAVLGLDPEAADAAVPEDEQPPF